jgi:hypothetical protein
LGFAVNGKINQRRKGIDGTENHIRKADQLGTHVGIGLNADITGDKKEIDFLPDRFDVAEIDLDRETEVTG